MKNAMYREAEKHSEGPFLIPGRAARPFWHRWCAFLISPTCKGGMGWGLVVVLLFFGFVFLDLDRDLKSEIWDWDQRSEMGLLLYMTRVLYIATPPSQNAGLDHWSRNWGPWSAFNLMEIWTPQGQYKCNTVRKNVYIFIAYGTLDEREVGRRCYFFILLIKTTTSSSLPHHRLWICRIFS